MEVALARPPKDTTSCPPSTNELLTVRPPLVTPAMPPPEITAPETTPPSPVSCSPPERICAPETIAPELTCCTPPEETVASIEAPPFSTICWPEGAQRDPAGRRGPRVAGHPDGLVDLHRGADAQGHAAEGQVDRRHRRQAHHGGDPEERH